MTKKLRLFIIIAAALAALSILTGCTSDTGTPPGDGDDNPLIGEWSRDSTISGQPAIETLQFNADFSWSSELVEKAVPSNKRTSGGAYTLNVGAGTVILNEGPSVSNTWGFSVNGSTLTLTGKTIITGPLEYTRV
jgi:hypothetical protein